MPLQVPLVREEPLFIWQDSIKSSETITVKSSESAINPLSKALCRFGHKARPFDTVSWKLLLNGIMWQASIIDTDDFESILIPEMQQVLFKDPRYFPPS